MSEEIHKEPGLPPMEHIRQAIEIYLRHAYDAAVPASVQGLVPGESVDLVHWIMSRATERDPSDAPLEQVRSFVLRLGNQLYPNMKLRLSRPPHAKIFLFSVDAHDAFLHAPPGSPDYEPLEQLKKYNAALVEKITAEWDALGLLTERNYLRKKILEARERNTNP